MEETQECDRVLVRGWSSTVKKDAGHEFKARIDVRDEKDQMANGLEARTGRPEVVLQCSLGLQRQL